MPHRAVLRTALGALLYYYDRAQAVGWVLVPLALAYAGCAVGSHYEAMADTARFALNEYKKHNRNKESTLNNVIKALLLVAVLVPGTAFSAKFSGVCDGVTDDTPALNADIAVALGGPDKIIEFPGRQCAFLSQPMPISGSVSLIGQSKSSTVLIRKFNGNLLTVHGQGTRIENLTLYADAGTTGGIGIYMESSESLGAGGNHVIRSVWITGKGTWAIPLFAMGQFKTVAPIGIRTITLQDVSVFNATSWAAELWNCIGCEWFGGGAYQGFGTTQAIAIGGGSVKNRVDANIDWAASTVWSGAMRTP